MHKSGLINYYNKHDIYTLMNNKKGESHKRTVAKTISWRIIATIITALLVFVFTGNFTIAVEVGALEAVLKLLFYYLHERGWSHIAWGTRKN